MCEYQSKIGFWNLPLAVILAGITMGLKDASAVPTPPTSLQAEVQTLFTTTDYEKLPPVIARWKEQLPPAERKQLLPALLRHVGSTKKLSLKDPERIIVSATRKPGKVEGKDQVVVRQDVFTEGGRAAWAVEQLLDCQLPVIPANAEDKTKERLSREAYEKVVEAMMLPLALLDAKQRAAFAASPQADKDTLDRLAHDTDVLVRRAVASNPRTRRNTIDRMRNDSDVQVKNAARENFYSSRTVPDAYPELFRDKK